MSSLGSRGRRRTSSSCRRPSPNTCGSTQESQNDEVQGVRGPNIFDVPPTNPNEREMISLTPDRKDFTENVTSTITHMCLSGWPTPAIMWKKQTYQHHTHVWEDFKKRYQWHIVDDAKIKEIFEFKAVNRVKCMMYKARHDVKKDAKNAYLGEDPENHIHEFNPPWVVQSIWVEMCQKWADPNWLKKSEQGVKNRVSYAPKGSKPMGTCKGGSVSQAKYHDRLASSNGGSISFIELYKRTREGLSKTQAIVDHYNRLMDEKYPSNVERPPRDFDLQLWEKASEVKKNFVKACGYKKTRLFSWGRASSSSSQSSDVDIATAAHMMRIFCQNPPLLI